MLIPEQEEIAYLNGIHQRPKWQCSDLPARKKQ